MGWLKSAAKVVSTGGLSLVDDLAGDGPDLAGTEKHWYEKERKRLEALEEEKREEAKFLSQEGLGKRRRADVSFGNEARLRVAGAEERSLRATGRFDSHRLVL